MHTDTYTYIGKEPYQPKMFFRLLPTSTGPYHVLHTLNNRSQPHSNSYWDLTLLQDLTILTGPTNYYWLLLEYTPTLPKFSCKNNYSFWCYTIAHKNPRHLKRKVLSVTSLNEYRKLFAYQEAIYGLG